MSEELNNEHLTEVNLQQALWQTRQESGGVSLQRIAELIYEDFDDAECEALIKNLKKLIK